MRHFALNLSFILFSICNKYFPLRNEFTPWFSWFCLTQNFVCQRHRTNYDFIVYGRKHLFQKWAQYTLKFIIHVELVFTFIFHNQQYRISFDSVAMMLYYKCKQLACVCACVLVFKWPWKLLCVNKCQHSQLYRFHLYKYCSWTEKEGKSSSSGGTMCWFFQLKCGDGDKLHMRSCVLLCVLCHFVRTYVAVSQLFVNTVAFFQTLVHMNYAWDNLRVCVFEKETHREIETDDYLVMVLIQQNTKYSTVIGKCGSPVWKCREKSKKRQRSQSKRYFE